jgi:ATP-dependent Clp protease ATP-binding subunit ClpA
VFERFTDLARKAVVLAQEEAGRLQHVSIGPEHVLLALLRLQSGVGFAVLTEAGIDYDQVLAAVSERAEPAGHPEDAPAGPAGALAAIGIDLGQVRRAAEENFGPGALQLPLPFSPAAKRLLPLAWEAALALGHFYVGTEHLLLALITEDEGIIAVLGGDAAKIRSAVVHQTAPWTERVGAAGAGISRLNAALRQSPGQPQARDIMHRLHSQAADAYRQAASQSQEAQQHLAGELERALTVAADEFRAAGGTPPASPDGDPGL